MLLSVIANRNRASLPINNYLLSLGGNINKDYLKIDNLYSVPSTGDYEIGIRFKVQGTFVGTNRVGLIGSVGFGTPQGSSYGIYWDNFSGGYVFSYGLKWFEDYILITDLIENYDGQVVDLKCGWYDGVGGTTDVKVFVNGNEVNSIQDVVRPTLTNQRNPIVGGWGAGNTPEDTSYIETDIHSWFFGNDVFEVNEGSGFTTVSNSGTNATGSTSNAGGLTYWNNNVWQEI